MKDTLYGVDFENKIADYIRSKGYTVYQSVYATHGKVTSQIDIVVFDGGQPCIIECKAWDSKSIAYKRSSAYWNYISKYNKLVKVRNPIKQASNQAQTLFMNLVCDLENNLEDHIPSCLSGVMLKGNISPYCFERVFTESEKGTAGLLNFLESSKATYLATNSVESIRTWLSDHSDTSEERLKEHGNYIRECIRNEEGLFDKNQYK